MLKFSAYDTLPCSGYVMDKAKKEVAHLVEWDTHGLEKFNLKGTFGISGAVTLDNSLDIPSFAHPVSVQTRTGTVWVNDLRACTKLDMKSMKTLVINHGEYAFQMNRTQLCKVFAEANGRMYLERLSNLPLQVYSGWVSENIARRFALDHGTQYRVMLQAAVFYCSLFIDHADWSDEEEALISRKVSEALHCKAEDVFDLIRELEGGYTGIEHFCQALPRLSENIRLKDFNTGLLYTLIGGTWSGYNAREVACVALEHVPTFLAMIYMGLIERSWNQTAFVKLVHRKGKREAQEWQQKLTGIYLSF